MNASNWLLEPRIWTSSGIDQNQSLSRYIWYMCIISIFHFVEEIRNINFFQRRASISASFKTSLVEQCTRLQSSRASFILGDVQTPGLLADLSHTHSLITPYGIHFRKEPFCPPKLQVSTTHTALQLTLLCYAPILHKRLLNIRLLHSHLLNTPLLHTPSVHTPSLHTHLPHTNLLLTISPLTQFEAPT